MSQLSFLSAFKTYSTKLAAILLNYSYFFFWLIFELCLYFASLLVEVSERYFLPMIPVMIILSVKGISYLMDKEESKKTL